MADCGGPLPSDEGTILSQASSKTSIATQTPLEPPLSAPSLAIMAPEIPRGSHTSRPASPHEQTEGLLNIPVHSPEDTLPEIRTEYRVPQPSSPLLTPTPRYKTSAFTVSKAPPNPSRSSPDSDFQNRSAQLSPVPPPCSSKVTPTRPLKTDSENMHLTVEIETGEKSKGSVQVSNTPEVNARAVKHTVDVRTIEKGQSRVLERSESEEALSVNLRNGERGKMTQLTLRWD